LTVTLTITDDAGGAAIRHAIKVLPRGCVVPRLVGRKLGGARQALKAAGCRLGAVKQACRAGSARAGDQAVNRDWRGPPTRGGGVGHGP
jgi:hypothetical protein